MQWRTTLAVVAIHFVLQRAREQVHIGQLELMQTAPPRQKQQHSGAQLFPHGSHQLKKGEKVRLLWLLW